MTIDKAPLIGLLFTGRLTKLLIRIDGNHRIQ